MMKELFEYFDWENFIIAVCLAIAVIAFVAGTALALADENVLWLLLWLVTGIVGGLAAGMCGD